MKAWKNSEDIDFTFSDSHQKTYQVNDDSKLSTLRTRLLERIKNSKNFILILSDKTKKKNKNLDWEIEKAFEYNLPFIIVYPEYEKIQYPTFHKDVWPTKLTKLINEKKLNVYIYLLKKSQYCTQ